MDSKKTIFLCAAILLSGHLLLWWLFYYSPFGIPTMILQTPINIHGLVLILYLILTYVLLFRRILKKEPETSIGGLTLIGGLAQLFAEAIFQLIRQFSYEDYTPLQHLFFYLQAIMISVILSTILAFLVAYQLKQRRVLILLLFIGLALVLFNLLSHIILL